jgi:NitT/TauT family transport system substrate-binding protein
MKLSFTKLMGLVAGLCVLLVVVRFRSSFGKAPTSGPIQTATGTSTAVGKRTLKIGFLPVTCHLTCPVADFASKTTASQTLFQSQRFTDYPTVVSAIQAGQLRATFLVAPLAMKLREDGVPVKICYLGHRDGSEFVIPKSSTARSLTDFKGKKVAIPSLYSNQHFVLQKVMQEQGLQPGDINFIPLPPPDMPTSLATGAIDAYFVGEPFCAKAEINGTGKILYYAKDLWPDFISCVLVVHESLINEEPEVVKDLVRGIASSGAWAETHRTEAAKIAAPYYRQDESLINYVLNSKEKRVSYIKLTPGKEEINQIALVGTQVGLLKNIDKATAGLLDLRFVPDIIEPAKIDLNSAAAKEIIH